MNGFKQTLVIIRHGEAVSGAVNPDRPLSDRGREQAATVGRWLARSGIELDQIRHSGKTRARETAELVAAALDLTADVVRAVDGLSPNDEVGPVAADLQSDGASVAVVGHLPHVARLASLLLAADGERVAVEFPVAGAMVLGRDNGAWHLLAFVSAGRL